MSDSQVRRLGHPPQFLFWLPVTKPWLRQLVLGLTLICHSSIRGVHELLADLFDYPLSVGSIHNILQRAVANARPHNTQQDLAAVRMGVHDEIFQAGRPVLVGADVASTYCYLLSPEEHRDADTWGVRLLELCDRGFRPDATIADFAGGLRAGQAEALPDVPCRGDVFHALQTALPLVRYLENRAYDAIATRSRLEGRQARTEHRQGRKDASLAGQLRYARAAETPAVTLADEVAVLLDWLRQDVLAVRGPDYAGRCALYDWIVAELRTREAQCPHRIRPVRCLLENHHDELLAFAKQLDQDLEALAAEFLVPVAAVAETRQVLSLAASRPEALAAGAGVVATLGLTVRRLAGSRDGVAGSGGACQQCDREPQQPLAELFLPASAPGGGLPGVVAILLEPSAFPTQRARRTRRQEPGRTANGRNASALADAARLHAFLQELTRNNGRQPVKPDRAAQGPYCYLK